MKVNICGDRPEEDLSDLETEHEDGARPKSIGVVLRIDARWCEASWKSISAGTLMMSVKSMKA